jgi:hypothetical protein
MPGSYEGIDYQNRIVWGLLRKVKELRSYDCIFIAFVFMLYEHHQ